MVPCESKTGTGQLDQPGDDMSGIEKTDTPGAERSFVPRAKFDLSEINLHSTWHRSHTIDITAGSLDTAIESPHTPKDPTPTIVLHGYGGFKSAYYQYGLHVARYGKRAIYYEESREDMDIFHSLRLHIRAVEAIMDRYSELYGFEQFDLNGQSMGGWIAVEVARRWPERVRSIVLDVSAGLEPHSTLSFFDRIPKFVGGELVPAIRGGYLSNEKSLLKLALRGFGYTFGNLPRTFAEGMAVSNCDIRPFISDLRQQGIKVACIVCPSDNLLPAAKTTAHSADLFDEYITFPLAIAGHLALQCHPAESAQLHVDLMEYWFGQSEEDSLVEARG